MIKKKHKNLYKQRLHVKQLFKKFFNSIKLFLLFSTEYRDVQYRVPRCPDTIAFNLGRNKLPRLGPFSLGYSFRPALLA